MESKAILKYARITPRKARRVINLIRYKSAGDAILFLRFMPYRGARFIEKLLKSAMSNAEQKKVVNPESMNIC
jgi:large subunit ribosomal protein L22